MARGIIGGMVFGGFVSMAAAGVISVVLDPPTRPDAAVLEPETATAPNTAQSETETRFGDADLVRDAAASQVPAPEPEIGASPQLAEVEPAPVPEIGDAEEVVLEAAETPVEASVEADPDEPVLPAPQGIIPEAPVAEPKLSISTDPAQPLPPPAEGVIKTTSVDLPEPQVPSLPEVDSGADEGRAQTNSLEEPSLEIAALPTITEPQAPPVNNPDTEVAIESAPEPVDQEEPVAEAATPDVKDAGEETASNESNDTARVQIGRPAKTLIERDADEAEAEPEADPVTEPDETAALSQTDAEPPSGPALEAFAVAFENPENKPLMSIILVDDGGELSQLESRLSALGDFPFPLTFAVDVFREDAGERMKTYRAKGYEVLALMDLPARSTAIDAEINIAAAFQTISEAVGLIEGTGSGLQQSREAAEQIVAALKESGHGFVLQSKGLNAIRQIAEREGVPSHLIFRDFDSAGQTARVIRRFLDQAAFRAGQEGGIVMLGRLRPDTVSALLLWAFNERAQRVALAPISAILTD